MYIIQYRSSVGVHLFSTFPSWHFQLDGLWNRIDNIPRGFLYYFSFLFCSYWVQPTAIISSSYSFLLFSNKCTHRREFFFLVSFLLHTYCSVFRTSFGGFISPWSHTDIKPFSSLMFHLISNKEGEEEEIDRERKRQEKLVRKFKWKTEKLWAMRG